VNRSPELVLMLVDALLAFHESRRSGIVRAQCAGTKKQLVLESGLIAFAESNVAEEHLARILLASKDLQRADLPRIAASMKSGIPVDQAILACCDLAPEKLQSAASEQISVILASLLGRTDCEVRLYKGESLLRRKFHLSRPVPECLLQAARTASRFPPMKRALGPGMRLRQNSLKGLEFPLDSMEAYALSLVDGETSVGQISQMLPRASAESLLTTLLLLGLASVAAPAVPASSDDLQPDDESDEIRTLLERFEASNYYEILSVPTDANEQTIRDAYHELARRYHPDRFQSEQHGTEVKRDADRLFTFITAAHRTLSDAAARAEYDRSRLTRESRVEAALQARGAHLENQKMAETLFRAGRRALAQKDHEKAITHLKECVWLCPEVATYRRHLAAAQSEIPRFRKEAEQHLLAAIRLDEMNAESYLLLGKLYLNINLPRKAEQQFHMALQWDPGNRQAEGLLAQLPKPD
jgi:curved DNA-binding protein CbpA